MKMIITVLIIQNILFACTIFDTKNSKNEILVGRNFDWSQNNGQVNFIPSDKNRYGVMLLSLDNPNMPYEGMNDKGLFIAISTVPDSETRINILKPIRKSLEMVKVILQKASTIDEAIEQFDKYSIAFGQFLGNPLIHFKIVQKDGSSAIVEFIDNKRVIIKGEKSRVLTNHYLSDLSIKADSETTLKRYDIVEKSLNGHNSIQEVFKILEKNRQEDTVWSTVYNLTKQEVYLNYKNSDTVKFNLKDELYGETKGFSYDMKRLEDKKELLDTSSTIQIRPHFGYGTEESKHYGLRVLLNASDTQAYGLELTKFQTKDDDFSTIGIVLEQRLWSWFTMSTGTIGYFDYKDENAVGLVSNLGWEPDNHIPFKPFITYRTDVIFGKNKTDTMHSLSTGFKFEF